MEIPGPLQPVFKRSLKETPSQYQLDDVQD